MTNVNYNTCDSCGAKESEGERHFSVHGISMELIGHLCRRCTIHALHLSKIVKYMEGQDR